jgi:hypothetical protein
MERVRTYLNPIRAEQLKKIAEHYGFDSIAQYLDSHIAQEWLKISDDAPLLPGFEIYSAMEGKEHIVFFAINGAPPVHLTARESGQFADGINLVLNDHQRTFFIASSIDPSILFFAKQGAGYQFIVKFGDSDKKIALSQGIAKDLAEIFKYQSTNLTK